MTIESSVKRKPNMKMFPRLFMAAILSFASLTHAATISTNIVCNDPIGSFEVAKEFANNGNVTKQTFDASCAVNPVKDIELDTEHPHILALGEKGVYASIKITIKGKTKYAILKIQ